MIRAIVVDDESPAREELIYMLEGFDNIKIIGQASHGLQALEMNKDLKPDLIFLDIKMPKLDGVGVARKILNENHVPYIVFVTAYEQYALKAFEVNAMDYILKPVCKERLRKGMNRIVNNMNMEGKVYYNKLNKLIEDLSNKENEYSNRISLYHNGKLIPLSLSDIVYATVEGKSAVIITKKGKFETNYTLGQLQEKLRSQCFFRSHKSYLINLDLIETIEPWFNSTFNVTLKNVSTKIPVSRSQSKEFKEIMNIS